MHAELQDQAHSPPQTVTSESTRSAELEFMALFARPKKSEVLRQRLSALFADSARWLLISQLLAIALAGLLWSQQPRAILLSWLCAVSLIALALALFVRRQQRLLPATPNLIRARNLYYLGCGLVGCGWGALALLLRSEAELWLAALTLLSFLILTQGRFRHGFGGFLGLTLTAMPLYLAQGWYLLEPPLLALPLPLLLAALLVHVWRDSRLARRQLFQHLEHSSLVAYLDNARQVAEQLNQQLSHEIEQRETAERALQQSQWELEQKIRSRTRELSEANDLLNQQIKLRKSISDALVKSQTRLSQAIEASHLALWDWDLQSGQVYQSHFNDVFGPREVSATDFVENMRVHIHPDDFERTQEELTAYLRGERDRYMAQYRVRVGEHRWMWVEDCGKAVRTDKNGRISRMLGTRRDITEEKQRDEELRMAKSVFDNTSEGVFVLDAQLRFVSINRAFTRITGYTESEVLGRSIIDISHTPRKEQVFKQARQVLAQTSVFKAELFERRRNGDYFPEWLQINAIRTATGEVSHYAGLFSDLTERKQADEKLKYLLNYDDLTGLANRALLRDRLLDALVKARAQTARFALLTLNVDRFKQINESLGHDGGDELLKILAQRLTGAANEADTVARIGSDEFCVLLEIHHQEQATQAAERILAALRAPLFINRQEILVTVSIGVTLLPEQARDLQPALLQANTAMRHAKYLGGNRCEFYGSALQAASRQRLKVETELRKALQAEALEVFYQPKLRLSNGLIDSVEALVRWQHPERGLIPPDEFVPIAEESGLIAEIGEWVLRTACQQAQLWQQQGLGRIKVAVNLSAYQLRQSSLQLSVRKALKDSGLDPRLLDLELTESALMENLSRSISLLGKLQEMGIRVTIDDFGTGYSSLSYLKRLPADSIKIDRLFIQEVNQNPQDAAITRAIILLAQSLNMEVVAEGVERKDQVDFLLAHGCDQIQGFFVSRPLTAERMSERLRLQQVPGTSQLGDPRPEASL